MDRSAKRIWNECLEIVRDAVREQSFRTWFEPLEVQSIEEADGGPRLVVRVPSRFYYEWLEKHHVQLLRKAVEEVLGSDGRLVYELATEPTSDAGGEQPTSIRIPAGETTNEASKTGADSASSLDGAASKGTSNSPSASSEPHSPEREDPASSPSSSGQNSPDPSRRGSPPGDDDPPVQNPFAIPGIQNKEIDSQLNESYTFERFIEGDCNQLARSAAWAIAQDPGSTSFNPYLVYGGVGLGKTHLIQAIGNYVMEQGSEKTVLYVSSERFTTEFVQSIQRNRIGEFSRFYRQVDVLIVDDVQFFSGKEKTQEEFFHIFNALHQAGKQIVLSADRPPREIEGIEERLLSRFRWGLSADVQPPGLETRIAILQRKADDDGIDLDQEVIEFIAHNVQSNIRELEGALIRLLAHATLHQEDLDLALAKDVLHDLVQDEPVNLTIEEIQRIVCEYMNIEGDRVRGKTRKREVVRARQIAMYFCKQFTQNSLKTIGLHFGGRDHSTVIHANNTVEDQMETNDQFRNTVEEIERKIELRSR